MEMITEFLSDWKAYVIAICVVLFCLEKLINVKDFFFNRFGIETKSSLEKKKSEESLKRLENKVEEINLIKQDINTIGNKVDTLTEVITVMQEKDNINKRANLKDRISQSYRYYHERQCWNTMEKEAFDDLIRSYEDAGGKNSFVHTICEPESNTWKLIDE